MPCEFSQSCNPLLSWFADHSYHASAEAVASMLTDLPYKICNAIIFNLTIYFMTNLRREPGEYWRLDFLATLQRHCLTPGAFFFFLLISFFSTLMMSGFFRSIAASSRTLVQALTPAAGIILGLVMYAGFAIPTTYMLGWSRWINYINPIAYAFESLMVNEFSGREFTCAAFIPAYPGVAGNTQVCSTVGATAGSNVVDGDAYINQSYAYYASNKWRNFGILLAFMFAFFIYYLFASGE
jgi:ATP-binding cassette subfamily G (WHITE) protein 2 (PDR)